MRAWWRVLKGVWPYRWLMVISLICAVGVGGSYASGVVVMLPVMKIFMSAEKIQGWANRSATESRLKIETWDLDTNIRYNATGLHINKSKATTIPELQAKDIYLSIASVEAFVNGKMESSKREADPARQWQEIVRILAHADAGTTAKLEIQHKDDPLQTVNVELPATGRWLGDWSTVQARGLVYFGDLLPTDPIDAFNIMVAFFIFLCFVGSAFRYYQQYLGMNVANRVIMDLRRRMYDRVVALPTSVFAQKGTSDLMSRLTNDTTTLTDGVSMALGKAVQEPVKAIGAFGAALYIDWKLTLFILAFMPFLGLIIRKFSKHLRKASRRTLESTSRLLAIINETLIGVRVVKAYSAEGYERRRFSWINKKLYNEQRKMNHYNALSRPVIETLAVIITAIPMMIAARWILRGDLQIPNVVTLLVCLGAMLEPMRKLSDVNARVQRSNAAATRVFEIIDMDKEPNSSHALPKLPRHARSIEFRNITFNYPGHNEIVLKNVSVNIQAGQKVAIVGGNGSGKTTLVQLLPRLYVPEQGQVLVDGIDTATVSLRSLRKQIGLVTQDTLLFADTIYNNIAYGSRHATREQVMDAARRTFVDEFVATFPEGYETRVGEHGVRLSGGQKQRIAIARAVLRDPSILILDEAMSQIDSDSEMKITMALREISKDRTVLMIAHRFQTVISADMIVCLDKGEVAGIGTHTQLVETCEAYRKLYENQSLEAADANGNEATATVSENETMNDLTI
ncbi:MAG: ABC transporter ATP-binding protein/permease [Phycisphaerales bacterium]|nr:ABC transporter ATP-binding protein/permease [Phycisphaerales bacterium]